MLVKKHSLHNQQVPTHTLNGKRIEHSGQKVFVQTYEKVPLNNGDTAYVPVEYEYQDISSRELNESNYDLIYAKSFNKDNEGNMLRLNATLMCDRLTDHNGAFSEKDELSKKTTLRYRNILKMKQALLGENYVFEEINNLDQPYLEFSSNDGQQLLIDFLKKHCELDTEQTYKDSNIKIRSLDIAGHGHPDFITIGAGLKLQKDNLEKLEAFFKDGESTSADFDANLLACQTGRKLEGESSFADNFAKLLTQNNTVSAFIHSVGANSGLASNHIKQFGSITGVDAYFWSTIDISMFSSKIIESRDSLVRTKGNNIIFADALTKYLQTKHSFTQELASFPYEFNLSGTDRLEFNPITKQKFDTFLQEQGINSETPDLKNKIKEVWSKTYYNTETGKFEVAEEGNIDSIIQLIIFAKNNSHLYDSSSKLLLDQIYLNKEVYISKILSGEIKLQDLENAFVFTKCSPFIRIKI